MKPVILWTDGLLFLFCILIILSFTKLYNNQEIKRRWLHVLSKPVGMITFIILCNYLAVTVLDSIHFRKILPRTDLHQQVYYSNKVYSALDWMLGDLEDRTEKTYSAPFSQFSHIQQTRSDPDGNVIRFYPKLSHGGSHLKDGDNRLADILLKTARALIIAITLSAMICVIMSICRHSRQAATDIELPWKYAYRTISVIIFFWVWVYELGSNYHILGTDQAGNDTLYESIKGIRTGILVGIFSTLFMLPIATILGISAGYFRGWIDDAVQYMVTLVSSIPFILLAAAAALLFQVFIENHPDHFEVGLEKADARFLALCLILALTGWAGLCRILRAETLKISQLGYVKAAHAYGVSHLRIITHHIMPNVTHLIMILFILDFSAMVLAEAVLSFIGVGVDPAMSSWGNMVNLARAEMARTPAIWWNLGGAFFFMFILVLSANLFSDLLNEAFTSKKSRH